MTSNIDQELQSLEAQHGFTRPDRGDLDDPKIQWRAEKPDYRQVDLTYYKGKTKNHPQGSLEMVVENLVKKWEMEAAHKISLQDWTTIKPDEYCIQVNGGRVIGAEEALKLGNYNWAMENVSKNLYNSENETFESSLRDFRGAFTEGFAWEVLEVYSGPPKVGFSWRHWGPFTGEYKGNKGNGETIEQYGFTVATVNSDLKIIKLEVYGKLEGLMRALHGKQTPEDLIQGHEVVGTGCLIHKQAERK